MNMHQPVETRADRFNPRTWAVDGQGGGRKRLFIVIAVLLGLAILAGILMSGDGATTGAGEGGKGEDANRPAVTVVVPGTTQVADMVSATGSISARRDMPVGVQGEGGAVTAVLVDAGDYVRAGQVLARIDRSVQAQQVGQLQASLEQARADAALAQAELDRALTLVDRGFISKADIDRRTATRDSANARVRVAVAQLREGQARLGRLDVRAPEAGLVLERNVEPGQVVSAGSPALFRIAMDGAMELRAAVAEQDVARLAVGQAASVQMVGSTTTHVGTVWMVEPVVDPQTRQGMARISLKGNRDLRPGAFASGRIEVGQGARPVLPESAVHGDAGGSYVLTVGDDGTVARRDVKLGTISSGGVAIVSGLEGNERVVLSAGAFLNPGEKVNPVAQAAAK